MGVYNHLSLHIQRIHCPLLLSVYTSHACRAQTYMQANTLVCKNKWTFKKVQHSLFTHLFITSCIRSVIIPATDPEHLILMSLQVGKNSFPTVAWEGGAGTCVPGLTQAIQDNDAGRCSGVCKENYCRPGDTPPPRESMASHCDHDLDIPHHLFLIGVLMYFFFFLACYRKKDCGARWFLCSGHSPVPVEQKLMNDAWERGRE